MSSRAKSSIPFYNRIEYYTPGGGQLATYVFIDNIKGNSSLSQQNLAQYASKASMSELNRPLSKIDIFYTGSTKNLAERKKSLASKSIPEEAVVAEPPPRSELFLSTIGLPSADDYADSGLSLWFHKYLNVCLGGSHKDINIFSNLNPSSTSRCCEARAL